MTWSKRTLLTFQYLLHLLCYIAECCKIKNMFKYGLVLEWANGVPQGTVLQPLHMDATHYTTINKSQCKQGAWHMHIATSTNHNEAEKGTTMHYRMGKCTKKRVVVSPQYNNRFSYLVEKIISQKALVRHNKCLEWIKIVFVKRVPNIAYKVLYKYILSSKLNHLADGLMQSAF